MDDIGQYVIVLGIAFGIVFAIVWQFARRRVDRNGQ